MKSLHHYFKLSLLVAAAHVSVTHTMYYNVTEGDDECIVLMQSGSKKPLAQKQVYQSAITHVSATRTGITNLTLPGGNDECIVLKKQAPAQNNQPAIKEEKKQ